MGVGFSYLERGKAMERKDLLDKVKNNPELLAMVEWHNPVPHDCGDSRCKDKLCSICGHFSFGGQFYPCVTIQAIEADLKHSTEAKG